VRFPAVEQHPAPAVRELQVACFTEDVVPVDEAGRELELCAELFLEREKGVVIVRKAFCVRAEQRRITQSWRVTLL